MFALQLGGSEPASILPSGRSAAAHDRSCGATAGRGQAVESERRRVAALTDASGERVEKWSLWKLSGRLFMLAAGILIAGLIKTAVGAPCNGPGAWISMAGLVPAALACVGLSIVAIKERSAGNLIVLLGGVAGTGIAAFVAFCWTILLCRAV